MRGKKIPCVTVLCEFSLSEGNCINWYTQGHLRVMKQADRGLGRMRGKVHVHESKNVKTAD